MTKSVFAFFDVDRTIRRGSAALDFCNYLADKGLIDSDFKVKDANVRQRYKSGEINYQQMVGGVVTTHAMALKGLSESNLVEHYEEYIEKTAAFFDWAEKLFEILRNNNVKTILVSAGIYPAIDAIGKHLKVSNIFTSFPEKCNNIYTGKVNRILHDVDKKTLVQQYLTEIPEDGITIGFGDSTGDVSMLKLMKHALIYDPHQIEMVDIANENHWKIFKEGEGMIEEISRILDIPFL